MDRSFLILIVAVMFEVIGTSALKHTHGFTRLGPIVVVFAAYAATFALMAIAMKTIPINVAYAVWSGLGTAGISVIGWVFFREPLTPWAALGICMIVGGIVVLQTMGVPAPSNAQQAAPTVSAAPAPAEDERASL